MAGGGRGPYRFVLVEGVEPEELPARLGDEDAEGAALDTPRTLREARRRLPRGPRESSSYDDRPVMAVGRAGAGWSFAFDGDPAPFAPRRFVSPAASAAAGTRAVVVWSDLGARRGESSFHLSVARDGTREYAFTCTDGEIRRTGDIPRALDPDRFFAVPGAGAAAERPLLEAVAEHFGVRLPRHALLNGRLHTVTTRSWTRPPGDGETYLVWSMA